MSHVSDSLITNMTSKVQPLGANPNPHRLRNVKLQPRLGDKNTTYFERATLQRCLGTFPFKKNPLLPLAPPRCTKVNGGAKG